MHETLLKGGHYAAELQAPEVYKERRRRPGEAVGGGTIVIWGADRGQFDEPERFYDGKRICVSGKLEAFRGRPQIVVHDPSQITIDRK